MNIKKSNENPSFKKNKIICNIYIHNWILIFIKVAL